MSAATPHSPFRKSRAGYRLGGVLVFLALASAPGGPWAAEPSHPVKQGGPAAAGTDIREQRVTKRVVSGDTLPRLLMDLGVSAADSSRWLRAVAKQVGVANVLRTGDRVHFYFIAPWNSSGPGDMTALQIERAGSKPLVWQLRDDQIVYHREKGPRPVASVAKRVAPSAEAGTRVAPRGRASKKTPTEDPALEQVTHVLRKGETLSRVLRAKRVSRKAAQPWIRAIEKRYPLRRLYPGRKIVLYFVAPQGGGRTLRALQIESRGGDLLTWQWTDGRIKYRGRNHRVVVGKVVTAPAKTPAATGTPVVTPKSLSPTRSFEPLEKVIRTVSRGQTLVRILRPLGVSGKEGEAWFDAIDKQYPVTRLKPGQRLHLYFDRIPARHRRDNLKAVELEVKKNRKLTWERVGDTVRFGSGRVLGRRPTTRDAVPAPSNGVSSGARKRTFLSEYALARIKQRNGLLEYTPPPNGTTNGNRPVPSFAGAERVTHRLKSGEHLWGVLRKYELDDGERRRWLAALQRYKYVRRLRAGSDINFYFKSPANGNGAGESNGTGSLQALEIVLRSDLRLTWYRANHDVRFYKDEVPYQQEVRSVRGVIDRGSVYSSAKSAGVNVAVISPMVDVLGWDINFQQDLRTGDTYRVLYRRKFRPGGAASDRIQILAAEFINQGRRYTAVYFEGDDGNGHYYNADGRTVSRSFLRYPVEFRRISSRFSLRRFHPVLKVRRPHYGVDFAARTGTPIRAVADGRITHARWKGAYGRLVEVSHGGGMKTRYAHMRRYGPGIRRGVSVKKGQTIGYVGCSGLCTGAHLHFEMWQDNRYVDPLKANVPVERQLDPLLMGIFEATRELFFDRLDADRKTAGLPSPISGPIDSDTRGP
jgi:murein DD-endopeptidase MepM/ murein hydrolase activator NlpD